MRKGLGFHARRSPGVFNPASLFLGGTVQGAWYDPSDSTTLFSDRAGTTPCGTPGGGSVVPVGLMLDKSQGLVLGSELVTPEANRDFSSDTGYWTKETGVTISGGAANWSATANSDLYRLNVLTVGKWYRITWTISSYTSGNFRLSVGGTTGVFRTAAGTYTETYYAASNGTLAITGQSSATGSVDNISVRELAGNHALAANDTTARPELRARVNLLTYSEDFSNADWVKLNATVSANAGVAPDGTNTADLVYPSSSGSYHGGVYQTGRTGNRLSVCAKAAGFQWLYFVNTGGSAAVVWFDVLNGITGTVGAGYTATITSLGNGWYRCTAEAASGNFASPQFGPSNTDNGVLATASGTNGLLFWGADLRPTNIGTAMPAYQRISDANTYDAVGFPRYLAANGTSSAMSTPGNVNLSGTDKVTVFAGVRKLSDAARGMVVELSASTAVNNGSFRLAAPEDSGIEYSMTSRGTIDIGANIDSATYAAPNTSVLSGTANIGAPSVALRINGTQVAINLASQGTGNFGSYPLFIGSRNNASFFLNGNLYSLIVVGSAVSAGQISATEQWVASKVGITI